MCVCCAVCSVPQSCPTLCDPVDCSLLGSSVHGISQVRMLEWVAISSFRGSSQPRDRTCVSGIGRQILYLWAAKDTQPHTAHLLSASGFHSIGHFVFINLASVTQGHTFSCCFSHVLGSADFVLFRVKTEARSILILFLHLVCLIQQLESCCM